MIHKTVEVTTVKPDNVEWFSDAYPEEYKKYLEWVKTLPGVMFLTAHKPNKNTIIRTFIFEDEAAANNYADAHRTNSYAMLRQSYGDTHGITIEINMLDE